MPKWQIVVVKGDSTMHAQEEETGRQTAKDKTWSERVPES